MQNRRKVRVKYKLTGFLTLLVCVITNYNMAEVPTRGVFCNNLTAQTPDTTKPVPLIRGKDSSRPALTGDSSARSLLPADTSGIRNDTLDIKISKDTLDATVNYTAEDSMVMDVPNKRIILYNKSSVKYREIQLDAFKIELIQSRQMVIASYFKDSTGQQQGTPRLRETDQDFTADSIMYNFKTQKGITRNTYTQQADMFIQGQTFKKVSTDVYYALGGRFTTCNLDHPHFAFRAKKMKLINKKMAVSGPVHPEFEGVPLPVYLPFGIYPLKQGRRSGFLPPQFATNEQYGLGLEGIGYYRTFGDHWDVVTRANIYSYGGWSLNVTPSYRKRYRYNGGFNMSIQRTKLNFKGDPDFISNTSYFISWQHSVDAKARPGTNFSASVNAGSTKFNQFVTNDPTRNFTNNLGSSVTYTRNMMWNETPVNLTVSANHSQNNSQRLITLNLPDVGFTINTLYPFQGKTLAGTPKWYEKLGIGYTGNLKTQVAFYDSGTVKLRQLIDTLQWGANHSIPITLSLPALGPLQLAPSISFEERWFAQKMVRSWNGGKQKVDTAMTKGFFTGRQVTLGLSASTAIFGTFRFKGKKLDAIRHVIRPTVSVNYKPDLAKNDFYNTQIDAAGNTLRFSKYEGSIFGGFAEGRFGGLSFGIDNNLEMKVKSKKDSATGGFKKVKLIDGFGISSFYNFLADSFQLSPFNIYVRSTLIEKINITASAVLDPYKFNNRGFRTRELVWSDGKFKMGNITNGNIAVSTTFRSKEKKKSNREDEGRINDPVLLEEQQRMQEYMRNNPGQFADFNIPWSVSLAYSLNFSRILKPDYSGFKTEFFSSINFNGDFNLTENWKVGGNGFYDFRQKKIQSFSLFITREMHCWQMAINVTPVGPARFFNITINPKASILQDLKITRTRYFYDYGF